MKYQDLNSLEQKRCLRTFAMFVSRHYPDLTIAQVKREFQRIVECADVRDYFKVSRIGEDFALNRVQRRDLYSLFDKAMNNEAFIREAEESGNTLQGTWKLFTVDNAFFCN